MKEFWNERYSQPGYAYGEEPNEFLKTQLDILQPGKILFPAEGEGRNAVYAATKGWKVSAFDQSEEGKKKADLLADKKGVSIDYIVNSFHKLPYHNDQFDALALIYAHFPADKKSSFHRQLAEYVRPGGIIIFEAFSKRHLELKLHNKAPGGPNDLDMLFSIEEIRSDFANFEPMILEQKEAVIDEGPFHKGKGSVIRFVGRKK